jgi:LEA14-like dessication related protein
MFAARRVVLLFLVALLVGGCSSRGEMAFEQPTVALTSFGLLPSDGRAPRFAIGLNIVNPNATPLRVRGLSYTVELEGHRMLTGVTSRIAEIPPYAESEIELHSAIDLLSSIRLFNELVNAPGRETLRYALNARLDVEGMLVPLRLIEDGQLDFVQQAGPR